ncbi:hypothetical protein N2604_37605 [Bradyrhizobium sp. CB1015]|nr:hypothetical protein [Bradyrhizobium sp. CB1015]UWU92069.1 hypothetical protein N2604_37605 [Bradyrhizobium sp. CB1015]
MTANDFRSVCAGPIGEDYNFTAQAILIEVRDLQNKSARDCRIKCVATFLEYPHSHGGREIVSASYGTVTTAALYPSCKRFISSHGSPQELHAWSHARQIRRSDLSRKDLPSSVQLIVYLRRLLFDAERGYRATFRGQLLGSRSMRGREMIVQRS